MSSKVPERFLAGVGLLAGVLGGEAIDRAGFGGLALWMILIVVIPTGLALAGARRASTFLMAAVALMTTVYAHRVVFNIRSQYYEAYGVRQDDVVSFVVLWGGALAAGAATGWATRTLSARTEPVPPIA